MKTCLVILDKSNGPMTVRVLLDTQGDDACLEDDMAIIPGETDGQNCYFEIEDTRWAVNLSTGSLTEVGETP